MGYIGLFVDRAGPDGQRVNIGLHHLAHGGVDHLVAPHSGDALESIGHNKHVKVPEPFSRAGVAGVQVGLILDPQLSGIERITKCLLYALYPFHIRATRAGMA